MWNSIVNFFQNTDNLAIIISIVALILSVLTMYWNRKKVSVFFDSVAEILGENALYCRDEHDQFINSSGLGPGLNLAVEIINSSPCDISYFDLRAFDPDTDNNYFLITRNALPEVFTIKKLYRENLDFPLSPYHHCLPNGKSGMLQSHSFTTWDLFIIPKPESTKLRVSFRVAIQKFPISKNDKYVTPNQKTYKYFSKDIDITNWKASVRPHLPLDTTLEDFVKMSSSPHDH